MNLVERLKPVKNFVDSNKGFWLGTGLLAGAAFLEAHLTASNITEPVQMANDIIRPAIENHGPDILYFTALLYTAAVAVPSKVYNNHWAPYIGAAIWTYAGLSWV